MTRLLIISMALYSFPSLAQVMLFDNFSNNPSKRWDFITDQVMGGVSTGEVEFKSEQGGSYARMSGTIRLENNGRFIQFRRKVSNHFDKSKKGLN